MRDVYKTSREIHDRIRRYTHMDNLLGSKFLNDERGIACILNGRKTLNKAFEIKIKLFINAINKIGSIKNIIDNIMNWQHSGFNIYRGQTVSPLDDEDVERLSQYIVRAPLSQERMTYNPEHESPNGTAKVVYQGKTTRTNETFTALDWLARLITHIPNKGEQTVRYYGYYSNKFRGMRKKALMTMSLCL